jgi:hypothetical protein
MYGIAFSIRSTRWFTDKLFILDRKKELRPINGLPSDFHTSTFFREYARENFVESYSKITVATCVISLKTAGGPGGFGCVPHRRFGF